MASTDRPDHLHLVADHTPGAHRTDSTDIAWWLPIIGPTSSVLAVILAATARTGDTTINLTELARTIGLGHNRSKLWASLDRLAMFGVLTFAGTDVAAIRLTLPQLTERQQQHLPDALAATYPHRTTRQPAPVTRSSVPGPALTRPTHSPAGQHTRPADAGTTRVEVRS
jgi:hypothetical protein